MQEDQVGDGTDTPFDIEFLSQISAQQRRNGNETNTVAKNIQFKKTHRIFSRLQHTFY